VCVLECGCTGVGACVGVFSVSVRVCVNLNMR